MGRNIGYVCNRSLCGAFERNALIIHLRKKTLYQYCWHRKQTQCPLELEWHKMSFHDNENAVCVQLRSLMIRTLKKLLIFVYNVM